MALLHEKEKNHKKTETDVTFIEFVITININIVVRTDLYSMIPLKRFDFIGQLVLFGAALILIAIQPASFIIPVYIAVGSWQFLSCLFHYLRRNSLLRQKSRHFFEAILIAVPVFIMLWLFYPGVMHTVSSVLLWISPALAVWYCYITYIEMNIWEARALIQLR